MKMFKGTHYWAHGFQNNFEIVGTQKRVEEEIKRAQELTWVIRTVIINDKGEVIYDEQKQNEKTATSKEDGAGNRTKKKKAIRKEDGSGSEWKRAVCLPQDQK